MIGLKYHNENVLMFSGGLDSLVAATYIDNPLFVHVNLHTQYSEKELKTASELSLKMGIDCEIIDIGFQTIPFNVTLPDAFIPARNLLLSIFGSWYGSNVCIGGIKGDMIEDNCPDAHKDMSDSISKYSRKQIEVFSPFWEMTKADIIKWYLENGSDEELLHISTSCYHPTLHQCGNCGSCFRKWVALKVNNIEPQYNLSQEIRDKYIRRAQQEHYDRQVNKNILNAIGE